MRIQIEGWDKLRRNLNALPAKLERKVIRQALRAGAKITLAKARQLVPVDSGDLRRALGIKTLRMRRKGLVTLSVVPRGGWFKGDQYYAALVEFGHRVGARAKGIKAGKELSDETDGRDIVPPHPFMKPAYEATKDEAAAAIRSKLIEGIEREGAA